MFETVVSHLVAKAGSIHSPQSPRLPAGSAVSVGAMSPAHRQPTPRLQELGMEILAQLLADDTTPAPPSTIGDCFYSLFFHTVYANFILNFLSF